MIVTNKLSIILDNPRAPATEVLILRDQFPHLNWKSPVMQGGTTEDKCQVRQLLGIVEAKYLTQFIRDQTRGSNTIDLILSNSHGLLHNYKLLDTGMSDHRICEATVTPSALFNETPIYNAKITGKMGLAELNFNHIISNGLTSWKISV